MESTVEVVEEPTDPRTRRPLVFLAEWTAWCGLWFGVVGVCVFLTRSNSDHYMWAWVAIVLGGPGVTAGIWACFRARRWMALPVAVLVLASAGFASLLGSMMPSGPNELRRLLDERVTLPADLILNSEKASSGDENCFDACPYVSRVYCAYPAVDQVDIAGALASQGFTVRTVGGQPKGSTLFANSPELSVTVEFDPPYQLNCITLLVT